MKHAISFSAPEYHVLAEAIDLGGHNSKEEPYKGLIFKRKHPPTGIRQVKFPAACSSTIDVHGCICEHIIIPNSKVCSCIEVNIHKADQRITGGACSFKA